MRNKFSWNNFSLQFIEAVVYNEETPKYLQPPKGYKDKDFLVAYINDICAYPNAAFVKKYRRVIENYFLNGTNYLLKITEQLEKKNYGGIRKADNDEMLSNLSKKRLTDTLCNCYIKALCICGKKLQEDDSSMFVAPVTVDMQVSEQGTVNLFPYQQEAVDALNKHFIEDNKQAGVLVMPTGSGKTRTSVYFLLKDMVSKGYQVIWLAHRNMLIEQAADTFYKFSPLIKEENEDIKEFKMACVSGMHATVQVLEKSDNVIVSSVQSLSTKTMYLSNVLSEKVIIVVDEAHHTTTPSYMRIVNAVWKKRPGAKLLGLTATPVRMTEKATKALMQYFGNNIIYSVPMSKLIADRTLSKPEYIQKDTNVDIEAMIDIDERAYIKKWGELPETLLEKVARTNERNDIIVDEYVKNKEKYGKTIVFALNGIHCVALDDAFKSKGIRSKYVYTLNNDNQNVIERFRHNEIDVLININILTEGSDIPDIHTVFLTRPTASDTLLMQMVGRGMRGAGCGGTETVNIVDFCDKWSSITCWMNPEFLLDDENTQVEDEEYEYIYKPISTIPVDMIRDIINGITYKGARVVGANRTLPVGWYDVIDADGCDTKVLVFENQLSGYKQFHKEKQKYIDNSDLDGKSALKEFFGGFGVLPSENELQYIIDYLRCEKKLPILQHFKERTGIEPLTVAKELREQNVSITEFEDRIGRIYDEHKNIIDSLYGSRKYYEDRVFDFIRYKNGIVPVGTRIEEVEKKFYTLSDTPLSKTIDELLDEVIAEQGHNLHKDFVRPEIAWTDKDYASYFGVYYTMENSIRINRVLNSESIPEEVVKFVIYHECLHSEIPDHSKAFRAKERLYPDFQEWEHFLAYKFNDFNVEEAL